MHSCIYTGEINHRRFTPNRNRFSYRLHMFYLDLAELPELFDDYALWSARGAAVASFKRADHVGDLAVSLDRTIRERVENETGRRPDGPIRLLTHLRYFGYCFNPISVYYCYDRTGELIDTVLEVSNTPWRKNATATCSAPTANNRFSAMILPRPSMFRRSWAWTCSIDACCDHPANGLILPCKTGATGAS